MFKRGINDEQAACDILLLEHHLQSSPSAMRRISPSTLRRVRSQSIELPARLVLSRSIIPGRTLASTSALSLPRSGPFSTRHHSSSAKPEEDPSEENPVEEDFEEYAPSPEGGSGGDSLPNRPFEQLVVSVNPPEHTADPLPQELGTLYNHVLTSFLSANQPVMAASSSSSSKNLRPHVILPGNWRSVDTEDDIIEEPPSPSESVLAVVSPFEGGRHYNYDAVRRIASEMDAEVLRLDLALGIGIHGPASPLGRAGEWNCDEAR